MLFDTGRSATIKQHGRIPVSKGGEKDTKNERHPHTVRHRARE